MYDNYVFLVIEDIAVDQYIARYTLTQTLGAPDNTVNIAKNGKEGLEWLQHQWPQQGKQLVILLDIQMPVMNGFAFLEAYKTLPEDAKKDTQLFVLSSTLNHDEIKKAEGYQFVTRFLNKPLEAEVFAAFLKK
jgi:CheY-like chemotaxis protein